MQQEVWGAPPHPLPPRLFGAAERPLLVELTLMRGREAARPCAAVRRALPAVAAVAALALASVLFPAAGAGPAPAAAAPAIWAHDSVGAVSPSQVWYLAEGATAGDFETWLLVQNPGEVPAEIDVKLHTGEGERQGPHDTVPPRTRRSYDLGEYAESYHVSSLVTASAGVVCERAMYGRPVVCLDPGHAATPSQIDPETGINTQDWINEPEIGIVYDIAVRAKAVLEAHGVRVVMTKASAYDPVNLKRRAEIANQARARMIVHIHADPGLSAPTTLYPGPAPYDWKANTETGRVARIDPAVQAASEAAARRFHAAMVAYLRQAEGTGDGGVVVENRGTTGTGNYGPIFSYDIWSEVPTFTLENNLAFADAHRQEIAEAVAAGVLSSL